MRNKKLIGRRFAAALVVCALAVFSLAPGSALADTPKWMDNLGYGYDALKTSGKVAIGFAQQAKLSNVVLNPDATSEVVQHASATIKHLDGLATGLEVVGDAISIGTSVYDVVDTYKNEGLPAAFSTAMKETTKFAVKKGTGHLVGAWVGGALGSIGGPPGMILGTVVGSAVGSFVAGKAVDYLWEKDWTKEWETAKSLGKKALDKGKVLAGMYADWMVQSPAEKCKSLARGLLKGISKIGQWASGELDREQALNQSGSPAQPPPIDPQQSKAADTAGKTGTVGEQGGQCPPYARTIRPDLPYLGANGNAADMYKAAENAGLLVDPTMVREGAVMVFPVDSGKNMPHGHVAVITGVTNNPDGTVTINVSDSNWNNDEKVGERNFIYDPVTRTAKILYADGTVGNTSYDVTGFVHEKTEIFEQKMAELAKQLPPVLEQGHETYKTAPGYKVPQYPDAPKYGPK